MPGGIDYSKWDRMQFSDDDDSDADEPTMTSGRPRVTRLDQPSQVTLSQNGEIAITENRESVASTATSSKPTALSLQNNTKTTGSSSAAVPTGLPDAWTEKGGSTPMGRRREDDEDDAAEMLWTQDSHTVTFRFPLPADRSTRGWDVRVRGMLGYVDRNVGVSTKEQPTLEICQEEGAYVLLPPTALPHPVHGAQDDDEEEEEGSVDWTIERSNDGRAYITVNLLKAAPMDGVVVWWNRPFEGADKIAMEWRSGTGSSNFQQVWDEAHRQFREKMSQSNTERGE